MTGPNEPFELPVDTHEVQYEDVHARGGRNKREETVIICTCSRRFSATGPAGTTQAYVRDKYNQHLIQRGQPPVFDDLPEGASDLRAEDPVDGQKRWIVDGGTDLNRVNEALESAPPTETHELLVPEDPPVFDDED